MTTRDKQLVRDSLRALGQDAGPLSLLFYGRLFELDPSIRAMFHGDIGRQGIKLMSTLSLAVDSLDRFDELTPTLHAMGQRHTAYGVAPGQYLLVEQALLWALGQALAFPAGSEVLAAWQALIREISAAMLDGAALLGTAVSQSQQQHPVSGKIQ